MHYFEVGLVSIRQILAAWSIEGSSSWARTYTLSMMCCGNVDSGLPKSNGKRGQDSKFSPCKSTGVLF